MAKLKLCGFPLPPPPALPLLSPLAVIRLPALDTPRCLFRQRQTMAKRSSLRRVVDTAGAAAVPPSRSPPRRGVRSANENVVVVVATAAAGSGISALAACVRLC